MTKAEIKLNNRSGKLIFLLAFALPCLMFLLLCAINQKLPFGDSTYLGGDMINQYINYFAYLQSIFRGENDAFYTYTKALGGDMTGLWAYYLLSPLNLVFAFVPKLYFPEAITAITAIKLGLCGLTMAVLLSKLHKPCFGVLIFSCAYAFMSYNMGYFNNIMWLDGVYMLPLVILGLERILSGKNAVMYVVCLALTLVFNYYIGYMICIFLVLFFAYKMALKVRSGDLALKESVFKFTLGSLLAGALAAVVLIPTALALSGTKASFDSAKLAMYPMYSLSEQLSKFVCSAMPTGYVAGDEVMRFLPFVYCGAVTTAFAIMYFFNSGIKRGHRIITAVFVLLLFLSFNYNGSYVIWHAFNYPALFPYRNAFLLSFVMIWLAWQCYVEKEHINKNTLIYSGIILAVLILLINPIENQMVSKKMIFVDVMAMLLCVILMQLNRRKILKQICTSAMLLVQCALLLVNANVYAKGSLNNEDFKQRYISRQEKVDYVKALDDGFYRLVNPGAASNEAMMYLYNGMDHFSSTEKTNTKNFAINFGLWHFLDVWVHYIGGGTSSGDAFLGIKYIMDRAPDYKGYEILPGSDFYLNPNALEIAFPASAQVAGAELDTENIFTWQEQVFSYTLGRDAGIFTPQENVEMEALNMSAKPFRDGGTEYNRINAQQDHALIYRFTVTSDEPLYMYTTMPPVEAEIQSDLSVNGEDYGQYMGSYHWRAVCLGSFEPGDELEVILSPQASFYLLYDTYFAYEDQQALAEACAEINARTADANLEKIKNSHLRWQGSVTEDAPILMLTVPNDKGWSAKVDGQPAEILTALDTLIAVELSPGEHVVELRFTPPGLYAGLGISLAGLALFILLAKKKKL